MALRTAATPACYGKDCFVEVASYTLHYVEVGAGEPVLLIPGSFSTYRSWNRPTTRNKGGSR